VDDSSPHRALLIGVGNYSADGGWPKLHGPLADIAELGRTLGESAVAVFDMVTELPDPGHELGVQIQRFFGNASPADTLLLYYSGHGDSDDDGDLVLTHRDSVRDYPDSTTEKFADIYQWARKSRARSICIILDCCKAGSGVKGAPPEFDGTYLATQDPADPPQRTLVMLFAIADSRSARDAGHVEELSPFTAMLCHALADTAAADDDGLVRFKSVTAAVAHEAKQTGQAQPRPFGDHTGDPILAQRPDAVYLALDRAGLSRRTLERTGGAEYEGRLLHIRSNRTEQLLQRISRQHPSLEVVGGQTGTGKTWMLCDVNDGLSGQGWNTVALQATIDDPDASRVTVALHSLARVLRADDRPTLLIIDGMESSDGWTQVVNGLDTFAVAGVSVLAAVEVQRAPSQGQLEGIAVGTFGSVGGAGALATFLEALFEPGIIPTIGTLTAEERLGATRQLRRLVGTDLWAAVHLAPLSVDPDIESWACAHLWRSRLGEITQDQRNELCIAAALSWYGIAVPLRLVPSARSVLMRLGATMSADGTSLRVTSLFVAKALLAGSNSPSDRPINLGRFDTDRYARRFLIAYIGDCFSRPARHEEGLAALRRTRRYRLSVFEPVVVELSRPTPGGRSDLTEWAREAPLNVLVSGMLVLRRALAPRLADYLLASMASRVRLGEAANLPLPDVLNCLAAIDDFRIGALEGDVQSAVVELFGRVQEEMAAARWPVQIRQRVMRLVSRLRRSDAREVLSGDLGRLLLRVGEIFNEHDLLFPLDLIRTVERLSLIDGSLRAEVAGWEEVDELLALVPVVRRATTARQLTAGAVLARSLGHVSLGQQLQAVLLARLPGVSLRECVLLLDLSSKHDTDLAHRITRQLDAGIWARSRFPTAQPVEIANALVALTRVGADIALASIRRPRSAEVDAALVDAQKRIIVSNADATGCGLLLRTVARVEEMTGSIENGFAGALATRVGTRFVEQRLRGDSRTKVILYLIEGFVAAGVPIVNQVRTAAAEMLGDEIRNNMLGRAPQLALSLAADHLFGPGFLMTLAQTEGFSRSRLLYCMKFAKGASAIADYHRLGVLMYPDVESEFAGWLEEIWYDNPDPGLFQALAQDGGPVEALRAAMAITETLTLAGESRPGEFILETYDRVSGLTRWDARLRRADDVELGPGIDLLRRLHFSRAYAWVEQFTRHLDGRLDRLHYAPKLCIDLLISVVRANFDVGQDLLGSAHRREKITGLVDRVRAEGDVINEVEFFGKLTRLERMTDRTLIDDELQDQVSASWRTGLVRLTHPRTLALALDTMAHRDLEQTRAFAADLVRAGRIATRMSRQARRDVEGGVMLLDVLLDVDAALVPEVVSRSTLQWLAGVCDPERLPTVVDLAGEIGWLADVRQIAADRIHIALEERLSNRTLTRWLKVVGTCGWHLAQHGQTLAIAALSDARTVAITRLAPADVLWGLGWLDGTGSAAAVTAAIGNLADIGVPGSPAETARVLATAIHLHQLDELFRIAPDDAQPWWHRAAAAGPQSLAVLAWAARKHGLVWTGLRYEEVAKRLSAQDARWKRRARQALEGLTALRPNRACDATATG
jgi:hypothetical protein